MHIQEPIKVINTYSLGQDYVNHNTSHTNSSQVNHEYQYTWTYNEDNSIIKQ